MSKPKVSKTTKNAELKLFIKKCKLYFSSLSARGAKYVYMNIPGLPDGFVITNGDYELLTSYVPISLTIHVVEFKDKTFLNHLNAFLQLDPRSVYAIRVSMIVKAFNSLVQDDVVVVRDESQNLKIGTTTDIIKDEDLDDDEASALFDEDELDDDDDSGYTKGFDDSASFIQRIFCDDEICGRVVENIRALMILEQKVDEIKNRIDTLDQYSLPHIRIDLSKKYDYFNSNFFSIPISLSDFRMENGEPHFSEEYGNFKLTITDGFDVPSVKEFAPKIEESETVQLAIWVNHGGTIQHSAVYETEELRIISARPYWEIVPIKTTRE